MWSEFFTCGIGSDIIEKNIILTNVVYLFGQKRSDMGLDWSILAVVLVLQRILPKLDELREKEHFFNRQFIKKIKKKNDG